jgi:ankyrin repeat protein
MSVIELYNKFFNKRNMYSNENPKFYKNLEFLLELELILKKGANPDEYDLDGYALMHYIDYGNCCDYESILNFLELLAKYNADFNILNKQLIQYSPLHLAILAVPHCTIIPCLLKNGAHINNYRESLLNTIVSRCPYYLTYFLCYPIDNINQQDQIGDTALHIACSKNDEESVEKLLIAGADKNIKNKNGLTPFEVLKKKYDTITELLVN